MTDAMPLYAFLAGCIVTMLMLMVYLKLRARYYQRLKDKCNDCQRQYDNWMSTHTLYMQSGMLDEARDAAKKAVEAAQQYNEILAKHRAKK